MYRLFASLILIIVIVVLVGFARGWFVVTTHESASGDHVNVGVDIDKGNIHQDTEEAKARARELSDQAKRDAQNLADKLDRRLHEHSGLTVSPATLALQRGSSADVKVTRDGTDLKAEQLALIPSDGSNLRASGGLFAANARETTVSISTPPDAHDGTVRIDGASGSQTVKVSISDGH